MRPPGVPVLEPSASAMPRKQQHIPTDRNTKRLLDFQLVQRGLLGMDLAHAAAAGAPVAPDGAAQRPRSGSHQNIFRRSALGRSAGVRGGALVSSSAPLHASSRAPVQQADPKTAGLQLVVLDRPADGPGPGAGAPRQHQYSQQASAATR